MLNYKWSIKDTVFTNDKGTVFSCFAGGGGSSLGYKLAGFNVIGALEIDPKMMQCYNTNLNPKYAFNESIQTFKERTDLPQALYNLDILDGSPPCTPFSYCGNRHHDWGKNKKYQEGQVTQVIDTLFFDFIELAAKLKPKLIVAENVEAILHGKAKEYVKRILATLEAAGYTATYYKLDAAYMGVPQFRKRVFFTAIRKDLNKQLPQTLTFNEPRIPFKDFIRNDIEKDFLNDGKLKQHVKYLNNGEQSLYNATIRVYGKPSLYQARFIYDDTTPMTLCAAKTHLYHKELRYINIPELLCCHSFPQDYNFNKFNPYYVTGMAVPPLMTAKFIQTLNTFINTQPQINLF